MKYSMLALFVAAVTSAQALANDSYPENPIKRPLTLADGMAEVAGGVIYGEENDDKRTEVFANIAYGVTDDFTIGFDGLTYRFLSRDNNGNGLELATSIGLKGFQESKVNGDSKGYGIDVYGKYVLNDDLAFTFGTAFVKWDEDKLKNKDEYRYHVGVMTNIAPDWTAAFNYTYRDLKDFVQDDAHVASATLNYAYNKNTDIGVFATYSDFDAEKNGYDLENSFDKGIGLYVAYRF